MQTNAITYQTPQLFALQDWVQPSEYALESEVCTIGRALMCHIVARPNVVSRLHARIERAGPRYLLFDEGSVNGTYVNGKRIEGPHLLQLDDVIGLGSVTPVLRFVDPDQTFRPVDEGLRYDEQMMQFSLRGTLVNLTTSQFRLLKYLYQHANKVCTREECAQAVWGRAYEPGMDAGALDELMNKLRRALRRADEQADLIKTRKNVGYVLIL